MCTKGPRTEAKTTDRDDDRNSRHFTEFFSDVHDMYTVGFHSVQRTTEIEARTTAETPSSLLTSNFNSSQTVLRLHRSYHTRLSLSYTITLSV